MSLQFVWSFPKIKKLKTEIIKHVTEFDDVIDSDNLPLLLMDFVDINEIQFELETCQV